MEITTKVLKSAASENMRPGAGNVTYLPNRPVVNEAKSSTKVRIVYDASAKAGEYSLKRFLWFKDIINGNTEMTRYRYALVSFGCSTKPVFIERCCTQTYYRLRTQILQIQ